MTRPTLDCALTGVASARSRAVVCLPGWWPLCVSGRLVAAVCVCVCGHLVAVVCLAGWWPLCVWPFGGRCLFYRLVAAVCLAGW